MDPVYLQDERRFIHDQLVTHSLKLAHEGEVFQLAGGGTSKFYVDVKKTAMRGQVHAPLAALLYNDLAEGAFGGVEAVAGVALGGCHLASIVGLYARLRGQTTLNVVHVRKQAKDHGTKSLVEGPSNAPKARVVLLEDVVTTGGSSIAALHALEEAGYMPVGTLAVIDRRPEDRRFPTLGGPYFHALFTLSEQGILGE
jgi:orotate phosphoribosyltransferase